MTEKKVQQNAAKQQIQVLQELVGTLTNRLNYLGNLGLQYSGDRSLYDALGYKKTLTYLDYYTQYQRQDIAMAVIDRPIEATWRGSQWVYSPDIEEREEDLLAQAWEVLYHDLKLKQKFIRLDKLSCLGRYGVLVMGFNDIKTPEDWGKPVETSNGLKLLYVQPYSEDAAQINTYEENTTSERFGLPLTYNISADSGNNTQTIIVHYSRIIHVAGKQLDSEIYGIPELQAIFNRLMDLEKIVGGSGEMFWRNARQGFNAQVDTTKYKAAAGLKTSLEDQMKEYEHNLRRFLVTEGVNLKSLDAFVYDPTGHTDVQLTLISAVTGIPKRILMGSERGELSSSQDTDAWATLIQTRREEYADRLIICEFVDTLMKYGILPNTENYQTEWTALTTVSDKDMAEVGRIRATALKEYTTNPQAEMILPPDSFYKVILGLNDEQIMQVETALEALRQGMDMEEIEETEEQPIENELPEQI